jgi:hypothetical protein
MNNKPIFVAFATTKLEKDFEKLKTYGNMIYLMDGD